MTSKTRISVIFNSGGNNICFGCGQSILLHRKRQGHDRRLCPGQCDQLQHIQAYRQSESDADSIRRQQRRKRHISARMVRDPGACRDRDESIGSIGDRDRCAAGRARDASTDEETRGGKGGCTGGGRHDDNEACEGCAGVHRGIRDRGDACSRLRDDAAQGVGGSTGDDG